MALRYPAQRILIRCPNWIGDAVMATASVRCLRRNYPSAHITVLLRRYVRPVMENAPWFDELVELRDRDGGLGRPLREGLRLRRGPRYDLALLLTHSFRSALCVWAAGAQRRVGHARGLRSWLLTDRVPWPRTGRDAWRVPKVELYSGLLEYLGCEGAQDQRPELFTSQRDEQEADRLLQRHARDESRHLMALVPGAGYGSSKLWEPVRFAKVADRLAQTRNLQAVVLTGPGESSIARQIAAHMRSQPIIFREGEMSLATLKAIVRRCRLMITNDTGPRHVAVAYNVPTVVLMGPTDPVVTQSDYPRTIILRKDVACGPCYLRTCPTDHRCMMLITPDMVISAAEELLDRFPPETGAQR